MPIPDEVPGDLKLVGDVINAAQDVIDKISTFLPHEARGIVIQISNMTDLTLALKTSDFSSGGLEPSVRHTMDLVANAVPYVLVLLIAGVACGFINTLASSGSAISLPMLITLGLPALDANATNRLPVLFGSLMALRTFHAAGKIDWPGARKIVLPATIGSAAGVYLAATLNNRQLGLIIIAALFIALLLLFTKLKEVLTKHHERTPRITTLGLLALSLVGVWLGFIILDGATYLLLVLIVLFGYDLPHANALKVFLLVTTTLVPIALFNWAGNIRWTEGLLLSAGSLLGGHFGAKLSNHEKAGRWVFRILVAMIVLELIHLSTCYF